MSSRTWMILGCLSDFVGQAGGAIAGAMMQAGGVVMPTPPVILLGVILGVVAVANHVKSSYLTPPAPLMVLLAVAAGWLIGP